MEEINFPASRIRTRRDHVRFLSLIETITTLHQYQREIRGTNGSEYLVADVEDYAVAYRLAHKIIGQIFKRISPRGEEIVNLVSENYPEGNFSRKMLQDLNGRDKETVKKYISEAVKVGYFEVAEFGGPGKTYSYRLAKSISELPAGTLISPEELRKRMAEKRGNGG